MCSPGPSRGWSPGFHSLSTSSHILPPWDSRGGKWNWRHTLWDVDSLKSYVVYLCLCVSIPFSFLKIQTSLWFYSWSSIHALLFFCFVLMLCYVSGKMRIKFLLIPIQNWWPAKYGYHQNLCCWANEFLFVWLCFLTVMWVRGYLKNQKWHKDCYITNGLL